MRICSGAGCLRAVPDDVRFCDECKPPEAVQPSEGKTHTWSYDAELDAMRKTARWQRTRAMVLRRDPMCKRCGLRVSEICDHVVPALVAVQQARDSGRYLDRAAGYYLMSNLQGLCRACHYDKTAEDKTHTGPWPDVLEREGLMAKRSWSF